MCPDVAEGNKAKPSRVTLTAEQKAAARRVREEKAKKKFEEAIDSRVKATLEAAGVVGSKNPTSPQPPVQPDSTPKTTGDKTSLQSTPEPASPSKTSTTEPKTESTMPASSGQSTSTEPNTPVLGPSRLTTVVESRKTHGIALTVIAIALMVLAVLAIYRYWWASTPYNTDATVKPLSTTTDTTTKAPSGNLAPSATVGENCGQKDCVVVPFQTYTVKGNNGTGRFENCVSVPNVGDAKVVRCKDQNGWTARFIHDPQGRLREVKHDS